MNTKAERFVLDSSAIIALMEDEDGADRVAEVLTQRNSILPYMVLLEVYYISLRESSQADADRRYVLMKQLPVKILWNTDEAILLTAGRFKAFHRISIADAVIAAYAKLYNAVLLHKDPEYEALADEIKLENLPFKNL
ncbi:MAG: type II toxin-antitoxin system VapC family toxin [Peptococcaceae bacterium]|nr:MAG: type II toxin-antitoxin system VapC family toxin [Peptococcaceae bacterium]